MLKKITTLAVFAAAIGVAAANAHANTIAGRVTSFSPTSISVFDNEAVTVAMNGDTAFTKLIIQKPWQEDTRLTAGALAIGRYVIVHADFGIANWVQVATDRPLFAERAFTPVEPRAVVPPVFGTDAARHRAEASALRAAPNASESKRPGSPGTAVHCDRMAGRLEKTAAAAYAAPADVTAGATTPDRESAIHRAEARARRAAPTASESKRPGAPDTAAHCDRVANELEKAGK